MFVFSILKIKIWIKKRGEWEPEVVRKSIKCVMIVLHTSINSLLGTVIY